MFDILIVQLNILFGVQESLNTKWRRQNVTQAEQRVSKSKPRTTITGGSTPLHPHALFAICGVEEEEEEGAGLCVYRLVTICMIENQKCA